MSFITDLAQKIIDSSDQDHINGINANKGELAKTPSRTEVINYLLSGRKDTQYLEIGVRNPDDNFNHIQADKKYSVDPGVEFEENPVDFKLTSDEFFDGMKSGEILKGEKFDVIFIDGLHLAEQVERDIENALEYIKEDGFIAMHDCNPPSEWHAREAYNYKRTPAGGCWNGTTWKAFVNARNRTDIFTCCINTDWGVGVISKVKNLGKPNTLENPYWEYAVMDSNRKEVLNLISFDELKAKLEN